MSKFKVEPITNCIVCDAPVIFPKQGHRRCHVHLAGEVWHPVLGYEECYEASSLGRIRSLRRKVGATHYGGKVLVQNYAGARKLVTLSKDNVAATHAVHVLIAEAFLGPRGDWPVCAHWDGDGGNNELSNLRWATWEANEEDKRRHDRHSIGDRNPGSKLSWQDIEDIRSMHAAGRSPKEIRERFGISNTHCWEIRTGKAWSPNGNQARRDRRLRATGKAL